MAIHYGAHWYLGNPPSISDSEGFTLHLGPSILHTVAFVGYEDTSSPTGFKCEGTAFFLYYKEHGYLVTARHVADVLGLDPFIIRVNKSGKAAHIIADNVLWTLHPDKLVDVAVTPIALTVGRGFETQYLIDDMLLTSDRIAEHGIDVGDFAYTVGLFHFVHGREHNLPLVHTGHISLMPPKGEKIPIGDGSGGREWVEAYLIESSAINGASGSPVFARPSIRFGPIQLTNAGEETRAILSEHRVFLLGLFQGAWFLPPDDPLRKAVQTKHGDVVPVGMGIVVPANKIIEVLEDPNLQAERAKKPAFAARKAGVSHQSDDARPDSVESPTHREDFNRLLGAAARKREQED